MTKEQRAKLAIAKREAEIKEENEKRERARKEREALEREAEELANKERSKQSASSGGRRKFYFLFSILGLLTTSVQHRPRSL